MEATEPVLRESFLVLRDLIRLVRLLQQDSIYCNGMTLNQFIILDHLHEAAGEMELSQLHRLLSVDNSTTTRLISPLLTRGWLERQPSARDSRAASLRLTALGEQMHAAFWQSLVQNLEPLAPALSSRENQRAIQHFIQQLGQCCCC